MDWWDYRRNWISFNFVCSFNPDGGPRKEILEFDNRPPDTGSTVYSELANQPTRKALSTYVVYSKNRHKVGRWSRIMKHEEKI